MQTRSPSLRLAAPLWAALASIALLPLVADLAGPTAAAAADGRHAAEHHRVAKEPHAGKRRQRAAKRRHRARIAAGRARVSQRRALGRAPFRRASGPRSQSSSVAPDPSCGLVRDLPSAVPEMTLPGCQLLGSDSAVAANPIPFWGSVECGTSVTRPDGSRQQQLTGDADPHPGAGGEGADSFFRRLTVRDGDDYWGERCELGRNDHGSGPTAFYHEGQRRVTYFSERLPSNFPLATREWQTVMQMKQAQPSHDDGSGVALELQAIDGKWIVANRWEAVHAFPARTGAWTRFAWDVFYSQDPARGWLQVSADLDGDGDFGDAGERSPTIHGATLATEVAGSFNSSDGLAAGASIPSHLRIGLYHDSSIPCPAPAGCSIELDNVQVLAG